MKWINYIMPFAFLVCFTETTPTSIKSITKKIEAYTQQKVSHLENQLERANVELEKCREHRRSLVSYIQQLNSKKRVRFQF